MKFNKKQIRFAVIAALVVLFIGATIFGLKFESADAPVQPNNDITMLEDQPTDEPDGAEGDLPEDTPEAGEGEGEDDVPANGEPAQPEGSEPAKSADVKPADGSASGEAAKPADTTKPADTAAQAAATEQTANSSAYPADKSAPPKEETDEILHCTIEIRCDTVADTSKLENQAVAPYVPADGVILATTTVEFTSGESVFDVLKSVTRQKDIQMEFREDPLYSGAYIEGINYLYEFDGGSLSGWMYKVNGQFPNYGCASYYLADGDEIVWMYTCDLGRDVGDNSVW